MNWRWCLFFNYTAYFDLFFATCYESSHLIRQSWQHLSVNRSIYSNRSETYRKAFCKLPYWSLANPPLSRNMSRNTSPCLTISTVSLIRFFKTLQSNKLLSSCNLHLSYPLHKKEEDDEDTVTAIKKSNSCEISRMM